MSSTLEALLNIWRRDLSISPNIEYWKTIEAKQAQTTNLPDDLNPKLTEALSQLGIHQLYAHQANAYQLIRDGHHVVIATGTASGKSLCYNLPVINYSLCNPKTTALYLFPTKALANDQLISLKSLLTRLNTSGNDSIITATYDGDTPTANRTNIRKNANILFTNPDMLHSGILPHHTIWADFFTRLRFVILDEVHVYRGVFGSHVSNVIRRLKRIANFYNSYPWFILTSATIGNPKELARSIVEEPVTLVDKDGSPHCQQHFLMYNPPITNPDLGLRRSASAEAITLAGDLIRKGIQTILFTKTRRGVEITLRNLNEALPNFKERLHGYRSGYLPIERRAIEKGLRDGDVTGVVSTNALELGIDIGGLDAAIMIGYPGSIAATRQQSGRAGRRSGSSVAILVASANPIDQFLIKHPDYILDRSPEKALINPDNLLILLQHLKCAVFELPFKSGDEFGTLKHDQVIELLQFLVNSGEITLSGSRYFWVANQYPAEAVSLRSTAGSSIHLHMQENGKIKTIGEVDVPSAAWMVHPGAIYLHEAQTYRVEALSFEENRADLLPVEVEYFTEASQNVTVEKISQDKYIIVPGAQTNFGEILVTSQVTGFKKISWLNRQVLSNEEIDMPQTQLRTTAFWLSLSEETVNKLREVDAWTNDPNNYGSNWNQQRLSARQRDNFTCQVCGLPERDKAHHVHHKVPFKFYESFLHANQINNLITLCPNCHKKVEINVRIQSGLAGLSYVLSQLSPLFLMCDVNDLGVTADPKSPLGDGQPTVAIYDRAPAGIGLSNTIFQIYSELIEKSLEQVEHCACNDGCPSCVGPSSEGGSSGKQETIALLKLLSGKILLS